MSSLTLSIVGKALFGTDLSAENEGVGRALTAVNHLLAKAFYLPWVLSLPTPQRRRLHAARSSLYTLVEQVIRERRRHRETHGDLLEMLLEARDEETGDGMTDQQVRDEVLTLLLAGHETTANALSWTFFLLAQHPHIEARLQEEYQRVLNGRPAMIEDLPQLPSTRMVLEEAMRLYPPAWGLGRRALDNNEIGATRFPKEHTFWSSPTSRIGIQPSGNDPTRSIPNGSRHNWQQDAIALPAFPLGVAHACVLAIGLRSTKRS
jgi:enediyne biosynthesis protein E7